MTATTTCAVLGMDRVDTHRLQGLVRLHRMGPGARDVARLLGMNPNTERTYRRAIEGARLLVALSSTPL